MQHPRLGRCRSLSSNFQRSCGVPEKTAAPCRPTSPSGGVMQCLTDHHTAMPGERQTLQAHRKERVWDLLLAGTPGGKGQGQDESRYRAPTAVFLRTAAACCRSLCSLPADADLEHGPRLHLGAVSLGHQVIAAVDQPQVIRARHTGDVQRQRGHSGRAGSHDALRDPA